MDDAKIKRNVFHFNALISVCEKCKNYHLCMKLLSQMEHEKCNKNEVTFSSAISTCEKTGQWQRAIDLLHQMKSEGIPQTAIAYNAAISACEKVSCLKCYLYVNLRCALHYKYIY
jgi:pentatricopeptide repeat domain-containing protein 1